jgi:hypothetical protein
VESWDVLREATESVGVKAVASKLQLSSALVYKWCQEPPSHGPEGSGALNPLDRVKRLYQVTQDARIINWLCTAAGGFYVPNPQQGPGATEEQLLGMTQHVVENFGELLTDISRSIENDGVITKPEAETIRQAWEKLKSHAESFVVACERGIYSQDRKR